MKSHIEILIDYSNSMGDWKGNANKTYLLADGTTRMNATRKILLTQIAVFLKNADSFRMSLFHSNGKTPQLIFDSFLEINEKRKLGFTDEDINKINSKLVDPVSTGGTPISAALKKSYTYLKNLSNDFSDRKLILITDGEETDGGDFIELIKEQNNEGKTQSKVFIVGISQDESAQKKSEKIAKLTGGGYVHLDKVAYDSKVVNDKLLPLFTTAAIDTLKTTAENIKQKYPTNSSNHPGSAATDINTQTTFAAKTDLETRLMIDETKAKEKMNNGIELSSTIEIIAEQMRSINERLISLESNGSDKEYFKFKHESPEFNENVRITSEKLIFEELKKIYSNVVWVNEEAEKGNPFDFEILLDNETKQFIECKGSMSQDFIFLLTKNEWQHLLQNKNYSLYFIGDVFRNPKIIRIHNFWEALSSGKIVPYSSDTNIYLKKDRIAFTIIT